MSHQISDIFQYVSCPYRWYLCRMLNMDFDNIFTIRGSIAHSRVNTYELRKNNEQEYEKFNLSIGNDDLYGIADAVLFIEAVDGIIVPDISLMKKYRIYPIEYKPAEYNGQIDYAAKMQCVAQAVCLETMFQISIHHFFIYYQRQHKRKQYNITEDDRIELNRILENMTDYIEKGSVPEKKYHDVCPGCLAYEYCMPDLKQTTLTFNDYYKKASK